MSSQSGKKFIGRTIFALVCALSFLLTSIFTDSKPSEAANSQFQAGNIIADAHFYNGNGLTAAEVQTFLNSVVKRCTLGDPGRAKGQPTVWNGPTFLAQNCLRDA